MNTTSPHKFLRRSFLILGSAIALAVAWSGCGKANKAAHLKAANDHYARGQYEKAEIEYKNVMQAEPRNPDAVVQLGLIYAEEGRLRLAIPFLIKARELKPDNLVVRRKLSVLYNVFGKAKEARAEALYILDHQPSDADAPLLLMEASLGKPEDLLAARQRLQRLPAGAADSAPVLSALAIADARERNLPAAEAKLKKAVAADPKFAAVYSILGSLYRSQKDLPKAEEAFKAAAELAPLRSGKIVQYAQFKIQNGDRDGGRRLLEDLGRKAPDYIPAQVLLAEMAAADKRYDDAATIVKKVLSQDSAHPEAMLLSARLNLAKGEPQKAVTELDSMLKQFPNSGQAFYYSGLAHAASGDRQKAIEQLNKAVKLTPVPEVVLALASLNLKQGDYASVVLLLKPFVLQRPENGSARMMLAEAYRGQGNFDDALGIYRQSEKYSPNTPQAPFMSGLTLLQEKKPDQARAAFEESLKRAPGYLPALEQIVYLDLGTKDTTTATTRLSAELSKNPQDAMLHALLARVHLVEGKTQDAETELKKAIELQPEFMGAYFQLAQLYISTHQEEKALSSLKVLSEKNPKDEKALLLTGLIYDQQKKYNEAREVYEKILVLNPKFTAVLNNLAYLYSEHLNEPEKAFEIAGKARELAPDEPHVGDTFGWVLYKKGQYQRALGVLEQSAEQLPNEAEVRYHLGVTQYMLGREDAARRSLDRALTLGSDASWTADAKKRLAVLARGNDESANSVVELEKASSVAPGDPIVLGRLAAAYEHAGASDKAVATYLELAKTNASNADLQFKLAKLYAAKKDTGKALEAARTARKLAPDDVDLAKNLGRLAFQMREFSWASGLLQDSARKRPNDADLQFDAAKASYAVGKVNEAEDMAREAINPPAPMKLATLTLTTNEESDALTGPNAPVFHAAPEARQFMELLAYASKPVLPAPGTIEDVLRKDPDNVPALMARAAERELQANLPAARQDYEKVLGVFPDFTPAKLKIAEQAAARPGADPKAYDLAVQARNALPGDPAVARALGILAYRQGTDFPRVVALIKQSLNARPDDPQATLYLGLAQLKTNDKAAAKKSLQKAIDGGLSKNEAAEARKALEEVK